MNPCPKSNNKAIIQAFSGLIIKQSNQQTFLFDFGSHLLESDQTSSDLRTG